MKIPKTADNCNCEGTVQFYISENYGNFAILLVISYRFQTTNSSQKVTAFSCRMKETVCSSYGVKVKSYEPSCPLLPELIPGSVA